MTVLHSKNTKINDHPENTTPALHLLNRHHNHHHHYHHHHHHHHHQHMHYQELLSHPRTTTDEEQETEQEQGNSFMVCNIPKTIAYVEQQQQYTYNQILNQNCQTLKKISNSNALLTPLDSLHAPA